MFNFWPLNLQYHGIFIIFFFAFKWSVLAEKMRGPGGVEIKKRTFQIFRSYENAFIGNDSLTHKRIPHILVLIKMN